MKAVGARPEHSLEARAGALPNCLEKAARLALPGHLKMLAAAGRKSADIERVAEAVLTEFSLAQAVPPAALICAGNLNARQLPAVCRRRDIAPHPLGNRSGKPAANQSRRIDRNSRGIRKQDRSKQDWRGNSAAARRDYGRLNVALKNA